MRYLYVVSIVDKQGKMQSYGISAPTKVKAEAEACRLAGVPEDSEPSTFQRLHQIDSEVV